MQYTCRFPFQHISTYLIFDVEANTLDVTAVQQHPAGGHTGIYQGQFDLTDDLADGLYEPFMVIDNIMHFQGKMILVESAFGEEAEVIASKMNKWLMITILQHAI